VYTGTQDRYDPWYKNVDASRNRRSSPPPPNMADFVYEIAVPPSRNGSPNRGGAKNTYFGSDDRGKNYYEDRSYPSVGRSASTNEQRRAASIHVGDSVDRRDRSRPRFTYHSSGGSRRPARSVRSARSRASAHGPRYYSSASDSSDEYGYNASRSRSRKRSSSGHNVFHDQIKDWYDDDYDNDNYDDGNLHIHRPSSNNSAMAPWAPPTPDPTPPNPTPMPPPAPPPRPGFYAMHNPQRELEVAKGLTTQQQRNQSTRETDRSSYAPSLHPPSSHTPQSHVHPYHHPSVARAQGISQVQSSEIPRDQPRSILRTSSLPPSSSTVMAQDSVSGESNTNTRVTNYDLEHRLSIMENRLASLGPPYTHPPPQFPPPPPLPVTPARKQKSVSIPIPESHAI